VAEEAIIWDVDLLVVVSSVDGNPRNQDLTKQKRDHWVMQALGRRDTFLIQHPTG
jgi:hypothetical protein